MLMVFVTVQRLLDLNSAYCCCLVKLLRGINSALTFTQTRQRQIECGDKTDVYGVAYGYIQTLLQRGRRKSHTRSLSVRAC